MESLTNSFLRPTVPNGKFLFYCTGSIDTFLKGMEVELQMTYNLDQCKSYLKGQLRDKFPNIQNFDLLIYFAGGVPFLKDTLGNIYQSNPKVKPYIYGILTRPIPEQELNKNYHELCKINDKTSKLLLSPICDSSENGLIDISLFLGYVNHDGALSDKFLKCFAAVTHFPPLITCLNRISDRYNITGHDIVTVTSSLYTFFTSLITPLPNSSEIFDFTIRCCNYIISIEDENQTFPMKTQNNVLFWEDDVNGKYIYYSLKPFDLDQPETKYSTLFAPIAPLSMQVVNRTSIVKGKDHNYLYLPHLSLKGSSNKNKAVIIDPLCGKRDFVEIETFAKEQGKEDEMINTEKVEQVILICLDTSQSMSNMVEVVDQCLTSFLSKIHGYKISSFQGLIKFNNKVELNVPFSPFTSDFEKNAIYNSTKNPKPHLWDALSFGCDEIMKFTLNPNGEKKFKNAVNRIIVISDGDDHGSLTPFINIAKKIKENQIIVDSVFFGLEGEYKELVTLCHLTGGFSFNPKHISDKIKLFEDETFLNYSNRKNANTPLISGLVSSKPHNIKSTDITNEFIQKAIDYFYFDTDTQNKLTAYAFETINLRTPKSAYSSFLNNQSSNNNFRAVRILKEIRHAENYNYDNSIVVFIDKNSYDIWQVCLKVSINCTYTEKWFKLIVTFPAFYPFEPPSIRFANSIYHLNISVDGKICIDILDKGYEPSMHIIDIITQIKELFIIPNIDNAIHIEILEKFINDREEYNQLAYRSTQLVGKDEYEELFSPSTIFCDEVYQPFTHGKKPELASSSVLYDREELKQLISNHSHRICIITGKVLSEEPELDDSIDDFEINGYVSSGMEDFSKQNINKELDQNVHNDNTNEVIPNILEDTFCPFIFNGNIDDYKPEDIFITPDMIKNSYHLNNNYKYFVHTAKFKFDPSPKEIDFKKFISKMSSDMIIIWIEKGSTFLTIAFISSNLYEPTGKEFRKFIEKIKPKLYSAMGESIVGNCNEFEPEIEFSTDEDIKEFYEKKSINLLQNASILNEIDFEKVRQQAQQNIKKQINGDKDFEFIFNHIDLFVEAEEQINKDVEENSIEFIIIGETIIANKYFEGYEAIKNELKGEKIVERFLYHGSRLKNHPRIVKEHFYLPDDLDANGIEKNDNGYYGKGIYATDNIFYASYYSNIQKERPCPLNPNEKISMICCRVIYNDTFCKKLPFPNKRPPRGKKTEYDGEYLSPQTINNYGIHQALVGNSRDYLQIKETDIDKNIVVANEYVFANEFQIIPISSFTIMRTDHFVLWIDEEKDKSEFADHLKILKKMKKSVDVNIYHKDSSNEAFDLIDKKKHNIMKLILSVDDKNLCSDYIKRTLEIFGSHFICLIYSKDKCFVDLPKQMENVLYTDDSKYLIEFSITKLCNIIGFSEKLEKIHNTKININENAFNISFQL